MKTIRIVLSLLCLGTSLFAAEKAAPFDEEYGYELLRYLYRWHMDDAILAEALVKQDQVNLYYRYLKPTLDEGDVSEHIEIVLPLTKMVVLLKRSEYSIPKLNLDLKDPYFKVQSAQHYRTMEWDASKYRKISYDYDEMMAYLFRTRNQQSFPDQATIDRLRAEALRVFEEEGHAVDPEAVADRLQIAYVAPISIVSNDLWFYWVNGRKFICFSADLHHSHERFWEFATLDVEIIDADEQVVVSNAVKDSHGYFTKDYVGRILFNCLIHGKQIRYVDGEAVESEQGAID
jgi:hypothetical protein